MATKERERQMRVVAEILRVHLPEWLEKDPDLARDLVSVVGTALETIHQDAEKSAKAWDKRAYHVRADRFRREWAWVPGAANYALGIALRPQPIQAVDLAKLEQLIRPDLEKPHRRQISDPTRFRGAAKAVRAQRAARKKPIRW
jgi:hypothetical protein